MDRARSLTERKVSLYIVNQNSAASDWAAARGEKWRAQLTGMEAMLAPVDPVLIQALHLDGPYRIADLACGGGGTTVEILRRAPAGKFLEHDATCEGVLLRALAHANEHLGQMIAYARVNGVVPPWSK